LSVRHAPTPDNYAHALIEGATHKRHCRMLAEATRVLIDPLRQEASFFRLADNARYHPAPLEADDVYRSAALPGFRFTIDCLWQRPLPPVAEVLQLIEA